MNHAGQAANPAGERGSSTCSRVLAMAVARWAAGAPAALLVLHIQAPVVVAPAPVFEAASVKLSASRDTGSFSSMLEGSQLRIQNLQLRLIIAQAYGFGGPYMPPNRLFGGPDNVLNARFDIVAKLPNGSTPSQVPAMLKALLAERFQLRIHSETRQLPVYELRVDRDGKIGPNLRASSHDCVAFAAKGGKPKDPDAPRDASGGQVCWSERFDPSTVNLKYAGSLSELIRGLQPQLDRPVIEATGLQGNYEWDVTFASKWSKDSDAPSVFSAVREQLGLKLVARTGPVDVFVIDSVEMPSPD